MLIAEKSTLKYATWLFGLASAWAGVLDLVFGEFEPAHQPIQAWGDHIPGIAIIARIAALWLVLGGVALLIRPAARFGAISLAILYAIFCFFPVPRIITAPHYMGHQPSIYIGVLLSIGQQAIVFIGAILLCILLWAGSTAFPRIGRACRWLFGLFCIDFGLAHFAFLKFTAAFIPAWIPFHEFWAIFTGIAFVLGGLGIVSGILDVAAARLTALMLFLFSILVLTPHIFATPHDHVAWGGNAYNLTAVAATWILSIGLEQGSAAEATTETRTAEQTARA